jgi:hypothetical protein
MLLLQEMSLHLGLLVHTPKQQFQIHQRHLNCLRLTLRHHHLNQCLLHPNQV